MVSNEDPSVVVDWTSSKQRGGRPVMSVVLRFWSYG